MIDMPANQAFDNVVDIAPKANTTIAYTDGACKDNPGQGGWGVLLILPNGRQCQYYAGEDHTTNNRMEMMAAIKAIELSPAEYDIEIWTDSSYLQKGMTQWIDGWRKRNWKKSNGKPILNPDLWQRLDLLCQQIEQQGKRHIHWHWLKGHAGHAGNEMADKLANKGVQYPIGSPDIHKTTVNISNPINQINPTKAMHTNIQTTITDNTTNQMTDDTVFDGDTSRANSSFRPLLPIPVNRGHPERQLIMDTETTGTDYQNDRIVEVGIVELIGRKPTGEKLHVYINPKKQMNEEVMNIHGISNAFVAGMPTFDKVAKQIYDFMDGAEVIAHNADFDMNFLTNEFNRVGLTDFAQRVQVIDTLAIARKQYPAQKNSLDVLVKRLNVGKQDRTFHGALLDSEILAEIYLALTGGQVSLAIDEVLPSEGGQSHAQFAQLSNLLIKDQHDDTAHQEWLNALQSQHPDIHAQWS